MKGVAQQTARRNRDAFLAAWRGSKIHTMQQDRRVIFFSVLRRHPAIQRLHPALPLCPDDQARS